FFSDILKDPQKADFDKSGEIRGREAVALGVALAMDAFGAGFGAAMMGFNPFTTSVAVGAAKLVLLPAGFYLGNNYFSKYLGSKASYLSGFVLIMLGILNLFNIV
ncbi:MAG: manganese efflux pump, partial [Candidatus Contubernalis sp.]|nr:manganese efflux pump [Candidatus Contubernalis sp.]